MKNLMNKVKQNKRRKDYMKKKNINGNLSKNDIKKRSILVEGDGLLPKSRKITKSKKK